MVVERTACGKARLNTSGRGRVVTVALTTGEAVNAMSPIFRAGTALTQATAIAATAHFLSCHAHHVTDVMGVKRVRDGR